MNHEHPRKLETNITVQHVDAETLVYDERRHQAFCLNATSAAVWNLADGSRSVEQLAQDASVKLAAPVTEELVRFALAELDRDGLLLVSAAVPAGAPLPTRRQMMGSLGAASLVLVPAVAMLVTPKAAQAYNGCVNCLLSPAISAARTLQRSQAEARTKGSSTKRALDWDSMFR